jgi:hypothetical protein
MRLKSVLAALGIAAALVLALDYASFAATGKSALLGRLNKANKVTAFQRTSNGPAVKFLTNAGQPPFAVNRSTKVPALNADLLDGKDASAFATRSTTKVLRYRTDGPASSTHTFPLGTLSPGFYQVGYTVNMGGASATSATPVWGACHVHQVVSNGLVRSSLQASASSSSTGSSSNEIALSATGVIDAAEGATPVLICIASKTWVTSSPGFPNRDIPVQITVTRLESPTVTSSAVD